MRRSPALEIAVQDARGVRIAREIGADRVELAPGLALGGLTPSAGLLELALEAAGEHGPQVHVLIRPRPGGFQYDSDEVEVMARDVARLMARGAHGVVIGARGQDGTLDREVLRRLVESAGGGSVTLHRVIDVVADPLAALRTAQDLGFSRVLTSGAAPVAVDGADVLRALVAASEDRIEIMAGSGVTADNAADVAATGVHAVHFSAKSAAARKDALFGGYDITDETAARAIRDALRARP